MPHPHKPLRADDCGGWDPRIVITAAGERRRGTRAARRHSILCREQCGALLPSFATAAVATVQALLHSNSTTTAEIQSNKYTTRITIQGLARTDLATFATAPVYLRIMDYSRQQHDARHHENGRSPTASTASKQQQQQQLLTGILAQPGWMAQVCHSIGKDDDARIMVEPLLFPTWATFDAHFYRRLFAASQGFRMCQDWRCSSSSCSYS